MTTAPPTAPGSRSGADRAAWWIVGAGVVLVLVQLVGPIAGASDLPYLATTVGTAIIAAVGLRRPGVDVRVGSMVTLGLAASALGDLAWQTYVWADGSAPDVS